MGPYTLDIVYITNGQSARQIFFVALVANLKYALPSLKHKFCKKTQKLAYFWLIWIKICLINFCGPQNNFKIIFSLKFGLRSKNLDTPGLKVIEPIVFLSFS